MAIVILLLGYVPADERYPVADGCGPIIQLTSIGLSAVREDGFASLPCLQEL
jgi:hypothetical protein